MGGVGASYRAWDNRYEFAVKLKELTPQPDIDPNLLARLRQQFVREATVLTRLHHRRLVRVFDFFEENGNAYLVVDFVEGESLTDRVKRQGPLPENEVWALAEQLLEALDYYHSLGGVHRDIKPQNIILSKDGSATLVDFGLPDLWDPRDRRTWAATEVMGTVEYAAPEVAGLQSGAPDARSDIYSVGAVLYYAVTGETPPSAAKRMADPFKFASLYEIRPQMRPQNQTLILRAMELRREQRFHSVKEMLNTLKYGPLLVSPEAKPAALMLKRETPAWLMRTALGLSLTTLSLLLLEQARAIWPTPLSKLRISPWAWGLVVLLLIGGATTQFLLRQKQRQRSFAEVHAPALLPRRRARPLRIDLTLLTRALVYIGGAALLLGGFFAARWLFFSGGNAPSAPPIPTLTPQPTLRAIFPTATAIPVPTATPTRAPTLTPTARRTPAGWSPELLDTFDDNAHNWPVSNVTDAWGSLERIISEGVYRWEVTAQQSVARWCTPDDAGAKDFYLAVDAQRVSGPKDADYGVVFRHTEGNYYLFSIRDNGYYRFNLWNNFAWTPVIDWTETTTIRAGASNHLVVVGQGITFTFSINDTEVAVAVNEQLAEGEAGLAVAITTPGDAVFEFDNFELRAPR